MAPTQKPRYAHFLASHGIQLAAKNLKPRRSRCEAYYVGWLLLSTRPIDEFLYVTPQFHEHLDR